MTGAKPYGSVKIEMHNRFGDRDEHLDSGRRARERKLTIATSRRTSFGIWG